MYRDSCYLPWRWCEICANGFFSRVLKVLIWRIFYVFPTGNSWSFYQHGLYFISWIKYDIWYLHYYISMTSISLYDINTCIVIHVVFLYLHEHYVFQLTVTYSQNKATFFPDIKAHPQTLTSGISWSEIHLFAVFWLADITSTHGSFLWWLRLESHLLVTNY